MLPRPKRGNPYLPTGVPRYPRHDNAKAGWSSSPNSAVGVVGIPLRSAFLGELDNDAEVRVSVPFYGGKTGRHKLGAHETLSIESIQCILGIL